MMRVILGISGGKDSTATALHLREQGIPFEPVFLDTHWEHPDTYAYLRDVLDPLIGPITWLSSEGMQAAVERKVMFPSRLRRFCTELLKVQPLAAHLKAVVAEESGCGVDARWVVSASGIRAEESRSRAAMPEWERWGADGVGALPVLQWRPLLRWTMDDVVAIHARHSVRPSPLYMRGASRVGCWPCIHARKEEVALVAREDPGRIALIRAMEAEQTAGARARARDRAMMPWPDGVPQDGELADLERARRDPESPTHQRTYFHPGHGVDTAAGIDAVAEWARTSRGGRQLQLIDDAPAEGCMRWGLCDVGDA